jgi:hypothetical protein
LVAGKKRVPKPATGKTALVIFLLINYFLSIQIIKTQDGQKTGL